MAVTSAGDILPGFVEGNDCVAELWVSDVVLVVKCVVCVDFVAKLWVNVTEVDNSEELVWLELVLEDVDVSVVLVLLVGDIVGQLNLWMPVLMAVLMK